MLFESIFCRVKDGHALSKVKRGGPRLLCKRDKQIRCVVGCRDRVYVEAGDQTADLRHKGRALILIHHGIVTGIADKGQIIAARLQIEELIAGGATAGRLLQQGRDAGEGGVLRPLGGDADPPGILHRQEALGHHHILYRQPAHRYDFDECQ